ncbi:hypothetical protein ACH5RR_008351 [Cinchona calisaya]|uniref:Uncharacterized protein n=1 Tax=Cinchona calisaya TaxID=153742 RepID=A0ABD3ABI4_9GENT
MSTGSSTHAVLPSIPTSSPSILGAEPIGYFPPNELAVVCQLCNHAGHAAKLCKATNDSFKSCSAMSLTNPSESSWYPDSGATACMTPHQGNLSSVTPYKVSDKIVVGNGSRFPIAHVDSATF